MRRSAILLIAFFCLPLAARAQSDVKVDPIDEPIVFSTTPEGLPAEELPIRDLDWSTDGRLLAVGHGRWTTAGAARIYDVPNRKLLRSFPLPKGVASVDLSHDGRWLAAACWDHKVHVWTLADYRQAAVIVGGTKAVRAAFSPDSTRLAVCSEAGELTLIDTRSWREARRFSGELFRLQHLAFSPDGKLLCAVGGSFDEQRFGRAIVFDVETGKQRYLMNSGNYPMGGVTFLPNGKQIATADLEGVVRFWNSANGRPQGIKGDGTNRGSIERVSFSPDGKLVAAAQAGAGMVRVWSMGSDGLAGGFQLSAPALAVAYSPDGQQLAAGGDDKVVHVLDAKAAYDSFTLQPLVQTTDAASPILALAASRDGRYLATAHDDLSVRLLDSAQGYVSRSLSGHSDVVAAVAFAPDSQTLATASYDRTIKLWPVAGGEPRTLAGHANWVFAVAYSGDGRRLASGGYDKTVRIWDPQTGQTLQTLQGHTATVRGVAFSPDGQKLVSGSADRTARLWDLKSGGEPLELKGHEAAVRAVAFSPDGSLVATGSDDSSVRIWEAATGKPLRTLTGHDGMVWSLAFSPGGRMLASGGLDTSIRIWDPRTGQSRQELKGHTDAVSALAFAADGRALVTASYDKSILRWTASGPPPSPVADLRVPLADLPVATDGGARFGFITPDQKILVTGNSDRNVKFWNLATGQLIKTVPQARGIPSGAISRDGTRLLTAGYGSQIYLWDVAQQRQLAAIETGHPDSAAVAISADNSKLAAGGGDGAAVILDARTHVRLHELEGDGLPIGGLDFSPDGKLLATASGDYKQWRQPGSVKLWDVASGRQIASLPGARFKMRRVRFTPDGQTLLASGSQPEVLVYDLAQHALKFSIPTGDEISEIAFLPDGKTLVLGQYNGTVSLYDLEQRKRLGEFEGHRSSDNGKYVYSVSISPDASVVVSAAADNHVKLWAMPPTIGADPIAVIGAARTLADGIRAWPAAGKTASEAPALKAVLARELAPHGKQVWFAVYSPDGSRLATGGSDAVVRLWNPSTWEQTGELKGHASFPTHAAWSPDGKRLATAGWDKKLGVWDVVEHKQIKLIDAHELGLRKVAWSPDGQTIASAGEDGNVCLWDAESLARRQLIPVGLAAYSVAFSPDGEHLAVGNGNYKQKAEGRISLWETATGKHVRDVPGSMGYVFHLQYLDPTHLLAANAGEGVTIWDLTKDMPEPSYRTPKDVRWVEASRDGRRIVAMHFDGQGWISLWDRGTARPLVTFNAQDAFGFTAAFSPDGKQIVSGGEDGKLKIWDLQPAEKSVAKGESK